MFTSCSGVNRRVPGRVAVPQAALMWLSLQCQPAGEERRALPGAGKKAGPRCELRPESVRWRPLAHRALHWVSPHDARQHPRPSFGACGNGDTRAHRMGTTGAAFPPRDPLPSAAIPPAPRHPAGATAHEPSSCVTLPKRSPTGQHYRGTECPLRSDGHSHTARALLCSALTNSPHSLKDVKGEI